MFSTNKNNFRNTPAEARKANSEQPSRAIRFRKMNMRSLTVFMHQRGEINVLEDFSHGSSQHQIIMEIFVRLFSYLFSTQWRLGAWKAMNVTWKRKMRRKERERARVKRAGTVRETRNANLKREKGL